MWWAMRNAIEASGSTCTVHVHTCINKHNNNIQLSHVEVMVWYGDIESHTGGDVQSTLMLAATSRLTANTSPDVAAR